MTNVAFLTFYLIVQGETLIHVVAAKGDSHEAVLAELLSLKTIRGNAVFNVLARNYEGNE